MSVLITGGAGFIGGWLARSLALRGIEVDIADDFSRGSNDTFLEDLLAVDGVRLIDRNLLAEEALSDFDDSYRTIYHLAARVGVRNVIEAPYATLRDNVLLVEKSTRIGAPSAHP